METLGVVGDCKGRTCGFGGVCGFNTGRVSGTIGGRCDEDAVGAAKGEGVETEGKR